MRKKENWKRVLSGFMATVMVAGSVNMGMPVHVFAEDSVSANDMQDVYENNVSISEPEEYDTVIGNHYYKLITTAANWADAEAACEEMGGHLITINSTEELEYIQGLKRDVWTGGLRNNFFDWYWITGEEFTYEPQKAPWNTGEPNSTDYSGENRVMVTSGAGLNDARASVINYYICEWDGIDQADFWTLEAIERDHIDRILNSKDIYTIGTHKYYVFDFYKPVTWVQAEEFCESMGGHLFTVNNEEEVIYNKKIIEEKLAQDSWIGMFKDSRRNWVWITGESTEFVDSYCPDETHKPDPEYPSRTIHPSSCDREFWQQGEPNNDSATSDGRAEIMSTGWNDLSSVSTLRKFVCEWDEYKKFLSPAAIEESYKLENCNKGIHIVADGTPFVSEDLEKHVKRCFICKEIVESESHLIVNEGSGDKHTGTCSSCGLKLEEEAHVLNEDGRCTICEITSMKDNQSLNIVIDNPVYNGKSLFPTVTIKDGDKVLAQDVDYVINATASVNAGEYEGTIEGLGQYYGIKEFKWTVAKAVPELAFEGLKQSFGDVKGVTVKVIPDNAGLVVTVEYKGEDGKWTKTVPQKVGKYEVRAYIPEGVANYKEIGLDQAVVEKFEITSCIHADDKQKYEAAEGATHIKECTVCNEKISEKCVETTAVKENIDNKDNSYDSVVYCGLCKQEIKRTRLDANGNEIKDEVIEESSVSANELLTITGRLITDANGKTTFTMNVPEKVYYTGKAIVFRSRIVAVDAAGKEIVLAEGNDYKLKFRKNVKAGTAIVEVKGTGEYKKSINKTGNFKIEAVDISNVAKSGVKVGDITADGKKKVSVSVAFNGKKLKPNRDYKLTVIKADGHTYNFTQSANIRENCQIKVTGVKNFTGEQIINVTVKDKEDVRPLMAKAKLSGLSKYSYTGKPVELDFSKIIVTVGEETLKYGEDFTIEYFNNVNVGCATAVLKALPESKKVTGTKQIYFKIVGKSVTKSGVSLKVNGQTVGTKKGTYIKTTGSAILPEIEVKVDGNVLKENVDYVVTYFKNRKPGFAVVKITGIGGYTGTKTVKFRVIK